MPVAKALYLDPFAPVLYNSPSLNVTIEQQEYIKDILRKACSDSRFVEKAYAAIVVVLTQGNTKLPTVSMLNPSTVTIGSPYFDIHVHGSNFTDTSKILFNGLEEPTTFVSSSELTTGVNMPLWTAPATVPVSVQNVNGSMSAPLMFEFLPSSPEVFAAKTPNATVVVKK
jgi:hypothetical protein